jgi:NAD(P)-dependent dehydrogenase (short-subunit alcohol dehydrogenase family)
MGICDGRAVIVTGAGRGLGRSHALLLAEEGAEVVVNDRGVAVDGTTPEVANPAQLVVDEITTAGGTATADGNDVASWEGAAALVDTALHTYGRLDGLVCNTGNLRDRMLVNISEDDWDAVINVHLKGHFCPLRHAAAYWRGQAKQGRPVDASVVFTTSGSGLFGNVGQANYSAAKAGIAALARVASAELGRYGVRVNTIGPVARTRMTGAAHPAGTGDGFDRLSPSNVSPLVAWLVSGDSGGVTGEAFEIFGGYFGVYEAWRRGPSVTADRAWSLADVAANAPRLLAERSFVPVAGTPEWEAWDQLRNDDKGR